MRRRSLLRSQWNSDVSQTRAVVSLLRFFSVLIVSAFIGLSVLPYAAFAADITYTGNNTSLLDWASNFTGLVGGRNLCPGTTVTPLSSDNKVVIDYDPLISGMMNPRHVFGGLSEWENSTGNSVEMLNGEVGERMYGGYSLNGNATHNTITASSGRVGFYIYGGYSDKGTVTDNRVTISGVSLSREIYGGYSVSGDVGKNAVTINSGSNVGLDAYGGYSVSGDVSGNSVTISGGTVKYDVYGGRTTDGNARDNIVTLSSGTVGRTIYNGHSVSGDATGNIINILGGTAIAATAGSTTNGNAENNVVNISGGRLSAAYGGYSRYGNATSNTVNISGGTIEANIIGAMSPNKTAAGNTVNISGGYIGYVYGAQTTYNADVVNTAVNISGGIVSVDVYSGYNDGSGNVENNTFTITNGTVSRDVYGGYIENGNASSNDVIISGGTVGRTVYGGRSSSGNAENNTVTISGGTIGSVVRSGYSTSGNAEHNTVTISGGTIGGVVYSGQSVNGNAEYNTVTISGGDMGRDVVGGVSSNGIAAYNTVTISDSFVSGTIAGGLSSNSDATYNTVTISGSPIFSATSYIYGGATSITGTGNVFTGNTLNFKSANISAGGVGNFEYYNFYLPDGTAANDTMLSVTNAVDLSNTTVEIFLQGNASLLSGDRVSLINSASGVNASPLNSSSQVTQGAFITYDFDLYTDANNLWAQLASGSVLPQSGILTDSRLAPLAFLNQGADLVASLEYPEVSGDSRLNAFAVVGGGSSTYDTGAGAEVDVDGFSLLAGVMWNAPVNKNSLIVSAFFEAGWGSYDTYRDFGGGDIVRGGGDTDYYGGGLHMRYKWDSDTPGGLYAEASLRVGRNKSDFYTNDLTSVSDFRYDSSSTYYGAHVGLGYMWQLGSMTRLEATSKYLWTRLGSDEVTSSVGDRISFDSISSSRWRTGFRMYHDYGNANAVTLYYGAAYEYEFSGDAEGRLEGLSLDGISLSGSSGIGELGVMFRPSKDNDRLTMQLGLQGYIGAREGFSGTLKLQYAF